MKPENKSFIEHLNPLFHMNQTQYLSQQIPISAIFI